MNVDIDERIERRAPAVSFGVTTLAALVGLGVLALTVRGNFVPGVAALGALLVSVAAWRGADRWITYGCLILALALVVAATRSPPPPVAAMVCVAVALCLAWDVGRYGATLAEQVGTGAATERAELAHTGFSAAVGVGIAGLGYGLFRSFGGLSTVGTLGLLIGATLLVGSIRLRS